jgi:hypothetical protein
MIFIGLVPVAFRCVSCKEPLLHGYTCICGSDEAEENLCEDEGCPHHGSIHVCLNMKGKTNANS